MNVRRLRILIFSAILVLIGAFYSAPSMLQAYAEPSAPGRLSETRPFAGGDRVLALPRQQQGPTDPQEMEAFLDHLFATHPEEYHIPGAVVSVVKDGKLFFAKGYGLADVEQRIPARADATLFRLMSITKLFTFTAVMQLVEQGKLKLDMDVNTYLRRFKIPNTYPQSITMAHLLTHTAGFEDRSVGIVRRSAADIEPLSDYLARDMPARIRPPGQLAAYSNYGTALAGYIVEEVSGLPYARYVEDNILKPLQMHHSTLEQPPPGDLAARSAVGYTYVNGIYSPEPFQYVQSVPAGALSATATDVAHFMIAHLQNGRYENGRILQDVTAREMHRQHFTHHPRLPGMTYGFLELPQNNQWIIGHAGGGGVLPFYSVLILLPEHGVGIYAAYNSPGGQSAREALPTAFLTHYYPPPPPSQPGWVSPRSTADHQRFAAGVAGMYRRIDYTRTTLEKYNALIQVEVTANKDGTLTVRGLSETPNRWIEVEPLVFREVDSPEYIVFREDHRGSIAYLAWSRSPALALEKVPWYETISFHFTLLGFSVLIFLSACVLWPFGSLIRRLRNRSLQSTKQANWARYLAGGISALNLILLSAIFLLIVVNFKESLLYGVSPLVVAVLTLSFPSTVGTLAMLIFSILAWRNRYWNLVARLHFSLITLAAFAFVWWLNYWNLLGFRF